MSSIINSDDIKKVVVETVLKALDECARQHDANGQSYTADDIAYEPTSEGLEFANTNPKKLSIKLEFYVGETTKCNLFCNPVIYFPNMAKE